MYKVISWDTGEIISEHASLPAAKRACRKEGCVLVDGKFLPVAFVTNGEKTFYRWQVVYNPRFRTATFEQIKNL